MNSISTVVAATAVLVAGATATMTCDCSAEAGKTGAFHRIMQHQKNERQQNRRAIYGVDSRQEHNEMSSAWQAVGQSTAMNIDNTDGVFSAAVNGFHTFQWTRTLTDYVGGDCDGTLRFKDQLAPGYCSSTLIAPNKIATAGHCINQNTCSRFSFVFHATADRLTPNAQFAENLIYRCQSVDISVLTGTQDWAVVTLDRSVPSSVATPVNVAASEVPVGTPIMMIGHPSRLPRKYAGDANVISVQYSGSSDFRMQTDLDAFGGNSGSGVFRTDTYEMIGILVSGQTDYAGSCPVMYQQGQAGETCSGAQNLLPYATGGGPPPPPPAPTAPTSAPTLAPTPDQIFSLVSGSCGVSVGTPTACICDCSGSGNYGNNEQCTINVHKTATLETSVFDVEAEADCNYDSLTVNGVKYCGSTGPADGTIVQPGSQITWSTDGSVTASGFLVCGTDVSTPPPPPASTTATPLTSAPVSTSPTAMPTVPPTDSAAPTATPTNVPSSAPSTTPTNAPTEVPTTAPTTPPTTVPPSTAPPTTGPPSHGGSPLFAVSSSAPGGACSISADGRCFTDGIGAHGNNERCSIEVLADVVLTSNEFNTENYFDFLTVNGQRYSGSNGPNGATASQGSTIIWFADYSITNGGFTVCGVRDTNPTVSPPPAVGSFAIAEASPAGACSVTNNGECFTDGAGRHSNNERCVINVQRDTVLQVVQFNTERNYDYITVNGRRYSGRRGPQAVAVTQGSIIEWHADYSITRGGFNICSQQP